MAGRDPFDTLRAVAGAVSILVAVAALALRLGRGPASAPGPAAVPQQNAALGPAALGGLAFASGAATLALEVLWTRMFAQVLQNSVYTFALILVIFLVGLLAIRRLA